jgi:hypothetical protein
MARQTPLGNVVTMLKAELSANMTVGVSAANDLQYASLIAAKQRWLADSYDWPFLEDTWDVIVPGGGTGRYNAFPTIPGYGSAVAINFERPMITKVYYSGNWQDVVYGINEDEFNYIDSDGSAGPGTGPPQVLDPIQRWRFAAENEFEVWPVPSVQTIFRFRGQSAMTPLLTFTANTGQPSTVAAQYANTLMLDDVMVMLFTAAEHLQELGKGNAPSVMARAQARMAQIRGCYPKRDQPCAMNGAKLQTKKRVVSMQIPILVAGGYTK